MILCAELPHGVAGCKSGINESAPLGNESAGGNACKAHGREPAEAETQAERQRDVEAVHKEVGNHGLDGILKADEPTLESKQGKSGGRSPDTYLEVLGGQFPHFRGAVYKEKGKPQHRPLKRDERKARNKGNPKGPQKDAADGKRTVMAGHDVTRLKAPESLGREPAGARPKESEVPVQEVEEHSADGNPPNQRRPARGTAKVARHGDIGHPDQRHGYARQDAGDGEGEDVFA